MANPSGRNIILLSDGTCNAAFSRDKSNVWRLYQALDQSPGPSGQQDQLVFYDNGVGTSGFKPLMALGAIFGWGLSRNVRDLYGDLCRHYQPGDRIYLFGFSRGAYTARVLADFIASAGIVDTARHITHWPKSPQNKESYSAPIGSEAGFKKAVGLAYKSYRQRHWKKKGYWVPNAVSAVGRFVRDRIFRMKVPTLSDFQKEFAHPMAEDEKIIEFMGVWDTVDALGLPVDEMSDMLDKYIYPYKFSNQKLGVRVKAAVQALAIDDARHTFHPLLWDQLSELDQGRIEQVWFAGMHSDVGGGYPDNSMALSSLCWMMDHAAAGKFPIGPLRFTAGQVDLYRRQADPLGRLHNSRQGAAVMYRYKPRNIHQLSHQQDWAEEVFVEPMILHHSVLQRIADQKAGYAPVNIPDNYLIAEGDLSLRDPLAGGIYFETRAQQQTRGRLLSAAEDVIAWGRKTYFCMLFVLLAVIGLPIVMPGIPGWLPDSLNGNYLDKIAAGGQFALTFAKGVVPGFWYHAYQQHMDILLIMLVIFGALFLIGRWTAMQVNRLGFMGWAHLKGGEGVAAPGAKNPLLQIANYVRVQEKPRKYRYILWTKLAPLVVLIFLLLGSATALLQSNLVPGGERVDLCLTEPASDMAMLGLSKTVEINLDIAAPCTGSGVDMVAGQMYRIQILDMTNPAKVPSCGISNAFPFCDGPNAANFKGLKDVGLWFHPVYLAGTTIKRDVAAPWFSLMAQVGRRQKDVFPITDHNFEMIAHYSGPLYFYVNDAVSYFYPDRNDRYYRDNNQGLMRIAITRLE